MSSELVLDPLEEAARIVSDHRRERKRLELRVRAYADTLAVYAHRLAVAEGSKNPMSQLRKAQDEVTARVSELERGDF